MTKETCHHNDWRYIEKDGREVMFQCTRCGETWWEDTNGKEDYYIPKDKPNPKTYDENRILNQK